MSQEAPSDYRDLILDVAPVEAASGPARMELVDVPKIDTEVPANGFDWKPTVLLVGIAALAILGVLYL